MRLHELRRNQNVVGKKTGTAEAVDFLHSLDPADLENYYVSSSMIEKLGINPKSSASAGTAPIGVYAFSAKYFLQIKANNPDVVQHVDSDDYASYEELPFGEGFKYINVFRIDPSDILKLSNVVPEYFHSKLQLLTAKYPEEIRAIMADTKQIRAPSLGLRLYKIVWNLAKTNPSSNTNIIANKLFRSIGIKAIFSKDERALSDLYEECVVLDTSVIQNRKLFVNSPEHIAADRDSMYPELLSDPHHRSETPGIALQKVLKLGKKIPHTEVAIARTPETAKQYVSQFLIPNGLKWESPAHEQKYPTTAFVK